MQETRERENIPISWLAKNTALTDANAAIFDSANQFRGCLPGIHEVLRRQGLLLTTHCLNPHEVLSVGQADEITRVSLAYPWLTDDDFVAQHRERWLSYQSLCTLQTSKLNWRHSGTHWRACVEHNRYCTHSRTDGWRAGIAKAVITPETAV